MGRRRGWRPTGTGGVTDGRRVNTRTCRAGLEPDPAYGPDPCEQVRHAHGLLTPADEVELARRRAKREATADE